jgi:hypothetical protein
MGEGRTIGQLADRVGAYCWVEHRLFVLMGQWAVSGGEGEARPEVTVFLATESRRHGALAQAWQERLPVRAGVDRDALVVAPPGPLLEVLERLDGADGVQTRLAGLVSVVLPRVLASYEEHLASANRASEGPVLAVLQRARHGGSMEIAVGQSLVVENGGSGDVKREFERMFGGVSGVLPGEWAS